MSHAGNRRVTVQLSVWFEDMAMEDANAAMEIVKSVTTEASVQCRDEIKRAMTEAGARNVSVHMIAF